MVVAASVGSVVIIAFFWLLIGSYLLGNSRRTTKAMFVLVVLAAVAVVLFLGAYKWIGTGGNSSWGCYHKKSYYVMRHLDFQKLCPKADGGAAAGGQQPGGGGGISTASLVAALAGGTLALVVFALAFFSILRRRRGNAGSAGQDDAVLEAVDESIDDLRRERDVRRAIIASYARMERALERTGAGRRVQEAPFEFLARILGRVEGAGPAVRALTELFERAKFSVEPMGLAEKERAIAALEELRMEVYA